MAASVVDLGNSNTRTHNSPAAEMRPSEADRWHFYHLAITDSCNLQCPVCYAGASPEGKWFLSPAEFREIATRIKADGGRRVSLSGGEPTIHPDLAEIIHIARREVGLTPTLVTNGLRIAEDIGYLQDLRKAGLRRVQLQFETLRDQTYEIMRGRPDASEKVRAIDNILAAGMRLGLTCMVCQLNLPELGQLMDYAQTLVPALRTMVFQPAVPVGRFSEEIKPAAHEDIIRAIVESSGNSEFDREDFGPLPRIGSEQPRVHPDCASYAILHIDNNRGRALGWGIDEEDDEEKVSGPIISRDGPMGAATGLATPGILPQATLRKMKSIRSDDTKGHFLFLSVLNFMCPKTRNEDRFNRCIVATITENGFEGLCERSCGSFV